MGGGGDYYKPKYVFKIGGRAYEPTPRNANARAGLVLAGLGGLLFWMVNTSLSCERRGRPMERPTWYSSLAAHRYEDMPDFDERRARALARE